MSEFKWGPRERLEEVHRRMTEIRNTKLAGNGICGDCGGEIIRNPQTGRVARRCDECKEIIRLSRRRKPENEDESDVWGDPWRILLQEFLVDKTKITGKTAWALVGVTPESRTQADNYRMNRVMKSLGFRHKIVKDGRKTARGYGL